jgi:hypothetical protein
MKSPKSDHAVWALLYMTTDSEQAVQEFFLQHLKLRRRLILRNLHLTVYHARRRLPGLLPYEEKVSVRVEPEHWRFMAIAPGGENPRPDIDVLSRPVGMRVRRAAPAYESIQLFRSRFLALETPEVLGRREASGERKSAFGSRHYQPHVTLLRSGSGIDPDLSRTGVLFRACIPDLTFDRFVVKHLSASGGVT